jgi:hypothetical protein
VGAAGRSESVMWSTHGRTTSIRLTSVGACLALGGAGAIALAGASRATEGRLVGYADQAASVSPTAMWAVVEEGHLKRSNGHVQKVVEIGPGGPPHEIAVTFDRNVTTCAFQGTPGYANGVLSSGLTVSVTGAVGVPDVPQAERGRTVLMVETTGDSRVVEAGMHLLVVC